MDSHELQEPTALDTVKWIEILLIKQLTENTPNLRAGLQECAHSEVKIRNGTGSKFFFLQCFESSLARSVCTSVTDIETSKRYSQIDKTSQELHQLRSRSERVFYPPNDRRWGKINEHCHIIMIF